MMLFSAGCDLVFVCLLVLGTVLPTTLTCPTTTVQVSEERKEKENYGKRIITMNHLIILTALHHIFFCFRIGIQHLVSSGYLIVFSSVP